MSNEKETIQRMAATIQENARELLKQDAEIKSLQSERDRLTVAGNEFIRLIYTKKDLIHLVQGEWPELVEALLTWKTITRKEGKDGE